MNQQNRDDRPPRRGNFNGERRGTGGERSGIQRGDGGNRGGQRYDERRGKREFDRQSGSDKTGVKAVDKRDGAGAHNWGTHKQDLDDLNKSVDDNDKDKDETTGEQKDSENEIAVPVEEEAKELTLDEWKAQRAVRAKPQFNIRKAGEGEDTSQWKKMVALNNKKKEDDDEELEYDPSMYPQRVGRQKHVLDIEFHFNDARRGGGGGGIGRGGRGGGGRGRGGPGGNRGGTGGQRRNVERPERTERGSGSGGVPANVETEREERGTEEVQPQQQQVRPAREPREVREPREPREPRGPRREHVNRNFVRIFFSCFK